MCASVQPILSIDQHQGGMLVHHAYHQHLDELRKVVGCTAENIKEFFISAIFGKQVLGVSGLLILAIFYTTSMHNMSHKRTRLDNMA